MSEPTYTVNLDEWANRSQQDIHAEVCRVSGMIVSRRQKTGQYAAFDLQHLRRQRALLQSLLMTPKIVWNVA